MKLIDFSRIDSWNLLREKIGAEYIEWDSNARWQGIDKEKFLKQLSTQEGIEVCYEELVICEDSTFELEGQKVLVYINQNITLLEKHT